MGDVMRWEEPPPPRRRPNGWLAEVRDRLDAEPGKWLLVYPTTSTGSYSYVKDRLGEGYEVTVRQRRGHSCSIYARRLP